MSTSGGQTGGGGGTPSGPAGGKLSGTYPNPGLNATAADVGADASGAAATAQAASLQKTANLSDVVSASTARTNLGLSAAATAVIDTTASDFQMDGTAAAGSTGKVADAGHVHPTDTSRAQALTPVTTVQNTNYTAHPGELVPVKATTANVAITLPQAPPDKTLCGAYVTNAIGAGLTITVAAGTGDTINGGTIGLTVIRQSIVLQYQASIKVWYPVLGRLPLNLAGGAAQLGTDNTVGGPSGSALSGKVVTAASTGGVPAWAVSTVYGVNQLVTNGGVTYICTVAHTSGSTFAGELADWQAVGGSLTVSALIAPSSDVTGATDLAAVNAALTAAGTLGGIVMLAPGQFYFNGEIIMPVTSQTVILRGSGRKATFLNWMSDVPTLSFTASTTSGSPTLTSVSSTTGITAGMTVYGPNLTNPAVVQSTTSNTITLGGNAIANASGQLYSIPRFGIRAATIGANGPYNRVTDLSLIGPGAGTYGSPTTTMTGLCGGSNFAAYDVQSTGFAVGARVENGNQRYELCSFHANYDNIYIFNSIGSGDISFTDCDLAGSVRTAVRFGGLGGHNTGVDFKRVHMGFGPFGLYVEASTYGATPGLDQSTFQEVTFEGVANALIYAPSGVTAQLNELAFINCNVSGFQGSPQAGVTTDAAVYMPSGTFAQITSVGGGSYNIWTPGSKCVFECLSVSGDFGSAPGLFGSTPVIFGATTSPGGSQITANNGQWAKGVVRQVISGQTVAANTIVQESNFGQVQPNGSTSVPLGIAAQATPDTTGNWSVMVVNEGQFPVTVGSSTVGQGLVTPSAGDATKLGTGGTFVVGYLTDGSASPGSNGNTNIRILPAAFAAFYAPTGLTGATSASRYVGGTNGGPPTSGTFVAGDYAVDEQGPIWVCVSGGSPGSWIGSGIVGTPSNGNTAIGSLALVSLNGAVANVAIGRNTLNALTTGGAGGGYNVAVGHGAQALSTTGYYNVSAGHATLANVTSGHDNLAFGDQSLANVNTGTYNVGVGSNSGIAINSGTRNVAIGYQALATIQTSTGNTGVGHAALQNATDAGGTNTALGYQSQLGTTSGNQNVSGGYNTLLANTTGSNNTVFGCYSCNGTATVSNITALGYNTQVTAAGGVAIGVDSSGTGASTSVANTIALGTASHQVKISNSTTGSGTAALGANCPAVTVTAPYTWFQMTSSDGSTVYVPAWK